jgi:epoxyqueuosine reductase QueG
MKAALRQRAAELGFDDCRITTAAPPASAEHFQRWLAEKNHGELAWLERNADKRVEPQKVLPGAKSVIVLAASYEIPSSSRRKEAPSENRKAEIKSEPPHVGCHILWRIRSVP